MLRECLYDIPKPLFVRISSGGEGIHVMSFHDDNKGYRKKYDDPARLEIDEIRESRGLVNNLLAEVKSCGSERKIAGEWIKIKNEKDCDDFIKERLKVMKEVMKEYNFKCNKCGHIKIMRAKDTKATIGHPNCGIYEYYSKVNSNIKPTKSKVVASKPFEPMLDNSKSVEPPYFHPKFRVVEEYRCPTCYEKNECDFGFKAKSLCFFDYKIKLMMEDITGNIMMENPKVEGVLSRNPSEFEIIEMEDIKQKINVYDIVRLIINRDDRYSIQNVDPNDPTKDTFPDKKKTLTYGIIVKSLKGEITIGVRPVNPKNNTIKWVAWDMDKEYNENPRVIADSLVRYLGEWYGLTGIIELSGSVDSYHVWIYIQPVDNKIAYDFDQNFRARLKSIGIGIDPKSIERGVQLGDGGMLKLPYNIQRKEKYGHKGGRSRFVEGVDLSKIIPEKLPAPWGNSKTHEINTVVPMTEEKTDPEINTYHPAAEGKDDQQKVNNICNDFIKNNEKVDGMLKCDKCSNQTLIYQRNINEIINVIKNNKHNGCGGNVSFGLAIYETSIEILKSNTESVRDFCTRLMENPRKKSEFCYEIRPTSNDNFENILILRTKTEKIGKELAGWLANSNVLRGKLHQPAPQPFKVEKLYDFSIDFAGISEGGV